MSNPVAPVRFAVLGCGAIAPTHLGAIQQLGHPIVAVADVIPDRAKDMAARFKVARVHHSLDTLLADREVDVVCICTPSGMHAEHGVACLRAGKHAIIEKPMEVSLAACDALLKAQKESGKTLSIISQHRFDPATVLAKKLIDSGRLGKIVLANADVRWWRTQAYYDSGDWRGTWRFDGGGATMNQGVHTVDVLQWLAGGVSSVFAHTRTAVHERIEVEDVAVAALTFKNGAVGTLTATTAAYDGYAARIEIFGSEGSILLEGDTVKRILLKDGTKFDQQDASEHAVRVAKGGTASVRLDAAIDRPTSAEPEWKWGDAHRAQIADVVHAIQTGEPCLINGQQGRNPVEVILALYQSSKSGQVVTLR
ncbi:MAG: Gfo/Idh/MocA family oxidoreductase [Tepidisphaeraceae bacterium]